MIERIIVSVWVGVSTAFAVGAGLEDPHSFGFALYVGGTVTGAFVFAAFCSEGPPKQ